MNVTVFHGSPRKGNTYTAVKIFMDEMSKQGGVSFTEFFLPKDLPEFCMGCQLCLQGPNDKCPHYRYVLPILNSMLSSDALVFSTPHYGACGMSGSMKNLLDHLDFLTLNIAPREEIFRQKAFIVTTGSGSSAAIKPISSFLKNWGINRVCSMGMRMFTDRWEKMPDKKKVGYEEKLRRLAREFYSAPQKRPYISTVVMYYAFRHVIKKYVGEGSYPYEYWKEKGYFNKRPF